MSNKPANIGTAENKNRSASANRSASQSVFDRINAYIKRTLEKDAEIGTNGKFYGFVLYSNPLTVDQFKQIFRNNKEFMDDVIIRGSESVDSKSSAEVLEMYVYVPQLSDFLPEPDITLLNEFISLKKEDVVKNLLEKQREEFAALGKLLESEQGQEENTTSPEIGPPLSSPASAAVRNRVKRNQEAQRIYRKLRKSLDIITMYPKVYKYTDTKDYYAPGTACEVEFPNDVQKSMVTMGYGFFKKELQGAGTFGEESGALKKIVEESSSE